MKVVDFLRLVKWFKTNRRKHTPKKYLAMHIARFTTPPPTVREIRKGGAK